MPVMQGELCFASLKRMVIFCLQHEMYPAIFFTTNILTIYLLFLRMKFDNVCKLEIITTPTSTSLLRNLEAVICHYKTPTCEKNH